MIWKTITATGTVLTVSAVHGTGADITARTGAVGDTTIHGTTEVSTAHGTMILGITPVGMTLGTTAGTGDGILLGTILTTDGMTLIITPMVMDM